MEKGIDFSKENIYDSIGRPDLKPNSSKLIGAIRMISLLARGAEIVDLQVDSTHWCSVKYWEENADENEFYLYVRFLATNSNK